MCNVSEIKLCIRDDEDQTIRGNGKWVEINGRLKFKFITVGFEQMGASWMNFYAYAEILSHFKGRGSTICDNHRKMNGIFFVTWSMDDPEYISAFKLIDWTFQIWSKDSKLEKLSKLLNS